MLTINRSNPPPGRPVPQRPVRGGSVNVAVVSVTVATIGACAAHRSWQPTSRDAARRYRAAPARRRPSGQRRGYTIAHAGRQVRFGPVAFWIAVGTIVIMAGWSLTTATYFAFRDDVLKGLIARQAQQQFAYEDRIAELRARIDRTTSRQLLDQEQFEQKLDELTRRETALESRTTALSSIADPTTTGSIKLPARSAADLTGPLKPSPHRQHAARRNGATQAVQHPNKAAAYRGFTRSRRRPPVRLARPDGGALRRQGAPTARRIRRAWPQARRYAGGERRPVRPHQAAARKSKLRPRAAAREHRAGLCRPAQQQPGHRCRCASR